MPRMNSKGDILMGISGIQGSYNQVLIPDCIGPQFKSDNEVVFLQPSDGETVYQLNIETQVRSKLSTNAANFLSGGGGNWAAWSADFRVGLFGPTINIPEAGLLDVGPDESVGFKPIYQADRGAHVREAHGVEWILTSDDVVYELQLLGFRRAIWRNEFFKIKTYGIQEPAIQIGKAFWPRALFIRNEWWALYFSDQRGLILHPFDSSLGYIISTNDNTFNPTAIVSSPEIIRIAWSTTTGESPESLQVREVNIDTEPVVELASIDIPAIDKPCWLGWFEFTTSLAYTPPSNCVLWVPFSGGTTVGDIIKSSGEQFAQWVQGESVESIEQQAQFAEFSPVCYWDSRFWPRLPTLPVDSWLAIQAYCRVTETPAQFESNMRAYLSTIPSHYRIALICQCYTSNASLTTNLEGIVPVYARLARDYPKIDMLLVFSDQGRATGLNDHPQLLTSWRELMTGIVGEPETPELPDNKLFPFDAWEDVVRPMHERYAQECIDLHPGNPEEQAREWTGRVNEQLKFSYPSEGWCWKSSTPTNPPSKDVSARLTSEHFDGWDMLLAAGANGPRDLAEYPPQHHDLAGQHPIEVTAKNWLGTAPSVGVIDILYFDPVVRRSDPNGMLIRFDVQSPNPVVEIELELLDDGEPSIIMVLSDEERRDGRYVRALAFKPTVNGFWTLLVSARDSEGNRYESNRTQIVQVTF